MAFGAESRLREGKMDQDVEKQRSIDRQQRDGEFAALFAQLDSPDAVASIDHGLVRLAAAIASERSKVSSRH